MQLLPSRAAAGTHEAVDSGSPRQASDNGLRCGRRWEDGAGSIRGSQSARVLGELRARSDGLGVGSSGWLTPE
jgi:hypothetical protein